MSLREQIRTARQAHEELRSSPPARTNLDAKADRYRAVKSVLDQLWEAADRPGAAPLAAEVRRAIRLLTVDAEYYAGMNDAEGFRDAAEASGQYDWLERVFADVG
jgi:hypothetical protein